MSKSENYGSENQEITVREKAELLTEDTRPGPVFRPDVDILEDESAFVILADLPGADEDSVEVQLEKGTLTLNAQVAHVPDVEGQSGASEPHPLRPRYTEYLAGGYHREFRISEDIDTQAVSAKMKEGVLELRLPKSAESRPRRVEVRAA